MKEHYYIVIMQRKDKKVNNGIRLSQIFDGKESAEEYAQEKRETGDFEIVKAVSRSIWKTIP